MDNPKFFHSVYLNEELCNGCINCIKRCPTQAIRVRNGKAVITSQFCIDCGECVRICAHHAKRIHYDQPDILRNYKYTVALPAPSLYSQFNNLEDINIVLTALLYMGFDDVFEVAAAAEIVSEMSRKYIAEHPEKWPLISTACPSVVRLIRVRFPNLIDHLLPMNPPVEVAARLARKHAIEKTGLASEDIGIIFISPCPSKVTYAKEPLGTTKSAIDGVLAIKNIYPMLLPLMLEAEKAPKNLAHAGQIGVGWGSHGGEAAGIVTDNYLAADGIDNVIRVLEDLEDQKFAKLQFIELNACSGGCVGGRFVGSLRGGFLMRGAWAFVLAAFLSALPLAGCLKSIGADDGVPKENYVCREASGVDGVWLMFDRSNKNEPESVRIINRKCPVVVNF